jgi:hypothetical protein
MQERRKVYAEYLAKLDELGYLTTHALGPGQSRPSAQQAWMQAHQRLGWLTQQIVLVGSFRVSELAHEVAIIFRDLDVLGATPEAVEAWRSDDDKPGAGPVLKRYLALRDELLREARQEVNAFPLDYGEEAGDATPREDPRTATEADSPPAVGHATEEGHVCEVSATSCCCAAATTTSSTDPAGTPNSSPTPPSKSPTPQDTPAPATRRPGNEVASG